MSPRDRPVRSQYRKPSEPKSPRADAIIVAPATYNTINKFAQGIADTYALGLLSEALGLGIPVVILPFINSVLATRTPFQRRRPRPVRLRPVRATRTRQGDDRIDAYPWKRALSELAELLS